MLNGKIGSLLFKCWMAVFSTAKTAGSVPRCGVVGLVVYKTRTT